MSALDQALRAAGFYVPPAGRTARDDYKSRLRGGERRRPEAGDAPKPAPRALSTPPEEVPVDVRASVARSQRTFSAILARPCPRHEAIPGRSCFEGLGTPRNFCSARKEN